MTEPQTALPSGLIGSCVAAIATMPTTIPSMSTAQAEAVVNAVLETLIDQNWRAPAPDAAPVVQGRCPACGWVGLFIGDGGHITCSQVDCPNPSAAGEILADGETEHLVTFTEEGWTIRHPLRERIGDQLETCDMNDVRALSGPPRELGTYRVVDEKVPGATSGWTWTPMRGQIFEAVAVGAEGSADRG